MSRLLDKLVDKQFDGKRYRVVLKSVSAHCCFDATVVDTQHPDIDQTSTFYPSTYGFAFVPVCECFEPDEAVMIAVALNAEKA